MTKLLKRIGDFFYQGLRAVISAFLMLFLVAILVLIFTGHEVKLTTTSPEEQAQQEEQINECEL